MFTISKTFSACCSHVLTKVHAGHPCGRMHGHNYEFELVLAAEDLLVPGFVHDYRDLDPFKAWVDQVLDHRHLNGVRELLDIAARARMENAEPTAEILARLIFVRWLPFLPALVAVRVRETPKTCAEYRP